MTHRRPPYTGAVFLCLYVATAHAAESKRVRLNTVGYLPEPPKVASILDGAGQFKVVREDDGAVVLAALLGELQLNADTQEQLATADFSAVQTPGEYRLVVGDAGKSAPFRIGDDVYRQPFQLACQAMYMMRCGTAVAYEHQGRTFQHEACHTADAGLDFAGAKEKSHPCAGGWHDAGDYNKYVVNAGVTVGVMFRAWDEFSARIETVNLALPDSDGALPDFLAEIKWELDWLLRMQADDGSVFHKVSARNFCGFVLPEAEREPRYLASWSSAATADVAALTAAAARHFRPYEPKFADQCLQAARKSYDFLRAHPENHNSDHTHFTTGRYDTHDDDDRLWAEAELWEATGDAEVLAALEARLARDPKLASADVAWDWGNVKNLALITYVSSTQAGRNDDLVAKIRAGLIAAADQIVAAAAEHSYARPLGTHYHWGCNGTVARQSVVLEAARRLTGDDRYRITQLDALNYLLGRNCFGRSFVTGLGFKPPLNPHDRRSGADAVAEPWPGNLVGGPERGAADWRDEEESFRTNEIAINWNAALIYALAAQLPAGASDN